METCIINRANATNSFQISVIGNVDKANFTLPDGQGGELGFLLKNNTEEPMSIELIPYSMDTSVVTIIYPGWNVELVREVVNQVEGLQYGY